MNGGPAGFTRNKGAESDAEVGLSDGLGVQDFIVAAAGVFDGHLGAQAHLGERDADGASEGGMGGDGVGFACFTVRPSTTTKHTAIQGAFEIKKGTELERRNGVELKSYKPGLRLEKMNSLKC